MKPCARCKHSRGIHLHYRRGTDCAVDRCDCPQYLSRIGHLAYRLRQRLSR